MANLLFLAHALPYPADRSDRVRSCHLLEHLAGRHRVFLASFRNPAGDEDNVEFLRQRCAEVLAVPLSPVSARLRSLNGLLTNEALTIRYFRDGRILEWVHATCKANIIDAAVVTSPAMAQYLSGIPRMRTLVDFVDVDSARWTQLARSRRWPKSWLSRREGERLLSYERQVVARAARAFFVSRTETELFAKIAPECAIRIETIGNGVDSDFFAPDPARGSPFAAGETPIVLSGNMDYLPNADAAVWFAREVLPRLVGKHPELHFHIVGRDPRASVRALAGPRVTVTGSVADLRPHLQHAAVVVAPLRVARGVKNSVLEAMAMARPVIASGYCAEAIDATPGSELLVATAADDFVLRIEELLASPGRAAAIGEAARQRMVTAYSWDEHLAGFDRHIEGAAGLGRPAGKAAR